MQEKKITTRKPAILVADDDPPMLTLFSRVLEIERFRLVTASDAATTLDLVKKDKMLSLVILQLEEKEQQSIEVCRHLREFSDVAIIIVAAKYEDNDIPRALETGADDFIKKPVGIGDFVTRVKAVLHRRGLLPDAGVLCENRADHEGKRE